MLSTFCQTESDKRGPHSTQEGFWPPPEIPPPPLILEETIWRKKAAADQTLSHRGESSQVSREA